ncbi:MAG: metal-dependent transcriptional regulator [Lachnospiraceae bacterium]|nr:metal-dependent transcriptional regulator [Lachnospiraceae bacterium]
MANLQESGEMYLETIYVLSKKMEHVRAIDVGEYMGYSKPSVSRAVGILKKGGYLEENTEDGGLVLTEEGRKVAERTYERHRVLSAFFEKIGVSKETAAEDACRIEHTISDETFAALKKYAGME